MNLLKRIYIAVCIMIGIILLFQVLPKQVKEEKLSETALSNIETGIIFIFKDDCPYCQQAKPILEEIKTAQKITYINLSGLNKDSVEYKRIESFIKENCHQDKVYVPILLNIKDGEVKKSHCGTIKGHSGTQMTEGQKQELKRIYEECLEVENE